MSLKLGKFMPGTVLDMTAQATQTLDMTRSIHTFEDQQVDLKVHANVNSRSCNEQINVKISLGTRREARIESQNDFFPFPGLPEDRKKLVPRYATISRTDYLCCGTHHR